MLGTRQRPNLNRIAPFPKYNREPKWSAIANRGKRERDKRTVSVQQGKCCELSNNRLFSSYFDHRDFYDPACIGEARESPEKSRRFASSSPRTRERRRHLVARIPKRDNVRQGRENHRSPWSRLADPRESIHMGKKGGPPRNTRRGRAESRARISRLPRREKRAPSRAACRRSVACRAMTTTTTTMHVP